MRRWTSILLLLAIFGLLPMCSTRPGGDGNDAVREALGSVGITTVTGEDYHGLIVVPVKIDGKECHMVVDTGANATVLRRDSFRRNWSKRKTVPVNPGEGSNIRRDVDMAFVRSLAVGGLSVYGMNLLVMDMPQLGNCRGKPVDGLLGMNVMGMFPLLVDLQENTLTFLLGVPADDLLERLHATPLPVSARNGHMQALMSLDGTAVRLVIDTGATQTCLPSRDWKGEVKERKGDVVWLDVNGKTRFASTSIVEVASVRWGGLELSGIQVMLGSDLGVVGADILSRGRILLDLRSRQAWWIPRN